MLLAQHTVCELSCLLPIGHSWPSRQDRLHNCSCSSTPTHTGISTHTPTGSWTGREHSMDYYQALLKWKKTNQNKKKKPCRFLFVYVVCFLLMDRILLLRSPPLAVWRPSWGRVTCSLLAWQSASPSRPVASICWPLTANRLDWSQLLKLLLHVFFSKTLLVFGRFVPDSQRLHCESEMHLIVRALL